MKRASLAAIVLALTGCEGHPSVFSPAGPASRSLATLGIWVIGALSFAAVLTIGIIFVSAFRRRGSLDAHQPWNEGGGQRWILIGGFLLPTIVLAAIFTATLGTIDRFPLHDGGHYKADIKVIGHQWWWEIEYLGQKSRLASTANEIHIPTGWAVEVELESHDVIHSFWVPSLHGKVDLVPGKKNRIRILADQPGRFEGQCAEFCGMQHARMKFVVVAEPLPEYEKWLAHQAEPAKPPADDEAKRGLALFETKACGLCHAIRGTRANGGVGPDLTHLASRDAIAAAAYPRSRAYLTAWITHAQSLKRGAKMPDVTDFDGEEVRALEHYLEGLE